MLTEQERARIGAAVTAAEANTNGEILVIVAEEVDDYIEVPLAWAAAVALLAPALAVWLGADPLALAEPAGAWMAAHASALDATISWALIAYATAQAVIFVAIFALVSLPTIRRLVTPGPLKRTRVRKTAMTHFMATGLDGAPNRTGVLIFAALREHRVEVIADELIHAKTGAQPWDQAVAAMHDHFAGAAYVDGFERAIALCGAALATHFPRTLDDQNTFPDAPRVI